MPKYYCDYCDTYLTHDSPSVRKTHCTGRKHRDNVKFYYQKYMEELAQHLIDATTAAFKTGKITQNPFGTAPPMQNLNEPPPMMMRMPPPFSAVPPQNLNGIPPMMIRPPPNMGLPNIGLPPNMRPLMQMK